MGGGLLNIIAYGNQNIILNGNPSKTFFKTVYAKYTNFGMQKFRCDYNGSRELQENNDTTYTFKIPRNGELILDTCLVLDLPDIYSPIIPPKMINDIWKPYRFKWIKNIGTSIIKEVRLLIGTDLIQTFNGDYIKCMVERDYDENKKKLFNIMTGNIPDLYEPESIYNRNGKYPHAFKSGETIEPSIRSKKLYIPLNFFFSKDTKLALPLTCLQYTEVSIEITLRPIKELFTINNIEVTSDSLSELEIDDISNNTYIDKQIKLNKRIQANFSNEYHSFNRFLNQPPTIPLKVKDYANLNTIWDPDVHLIVNYCFLSEEEQKIFCLNEQKYLIKDIKHDIFDNIVGATKVKLETNALVSNWQWFYRRSDVNKRNEWSNYTNWEYSDISPISLQDATTKTGYDISDDIYRNIVDIADYEDSLNQSLGITSSTTIKIGPGEDVLTGSNRRTGYKITPTYSDTHQKDILTKFAILLDGKYRENELDAGIYQLLEKYRATKTSSNNGTYSYNFCINTNDYLQPSGAMNLNRFKNIEFEMLTLQPEIDTDATTETICDEEGTIIGISDKQIYKYTYDMHLFEERYNVLRIMSGKGGLLFAR